MLEIENNNTVTERKNDFDGFISRIDMAKERLSELENRSIESSQTEKQREQRQKKMNRISNVCGTTKRGNICKMRLQEEEREKGRNI